MTDGDLGFELAGDSKARGRNGWFRIDRFWVRVPQPGQYPGRPIQVDFLAQRSGFANPPCSLHLTVEDAELLAGTIRSVMNPTSDTAWRPPEEA